MKRLLVVCLALALMLACGSMAFATEGPPVIDSQFSMVAMNPTAQTVPAIDQVAPMLSPLEAIISSNYHECSESVSSTHYYNLASVVPDYPLLRLNL